MSSVASTLSQSDRLASSSARLILTLLRARAILVLALLLILFAVFVPAFLTLTNLSILSKHVATSAILAIGMTFVILAGGIDLSVGSVVGLSGMVAGDVLLHGGGSIPLAILAALALGAVVGLLNGWLVTKAGVAPFIATLGTLYIARGSALLLSSGKTFPNLGGDNGNAFTAIGQGHFLGFPGPVWLMLLLFAFAWVIATKTPLGRHVYAVGGNERAARLAGIHVPSVKLLTYIFSAVCASVIGLVIAAQLEAAHPATGESFELNAIAAVVLGGTSLMGGRGSITGSLIGAFVIGVLADGLVMLGVSEFWQIVIKGVVIVLAVAVDQLQQRLQARLLPLLLRSSPEAGA
jgi:erythritol transport system permease protein